MSQITVKIGDVNIVLDEDSKLYKDLVKVQHASREDAYAKLRATITEKLSEMKPAGVDGIIGYTWLVNCQGVTCYPSEKIRLLKRDKRNKIT